VSAIVAAVSAKKAANPVAQVALMASAASNIIKACSR